MVNNLIETLLGGISKNDFWVMEKSCVLASPHSFETKIPLMLQKITLPLSEEGVLVNHSNKITSIQNMLFTMEEKQVQLINTMETNHAKQISVMKAN